MQKIRPDMDIGHNINRLRQRAGLTQDQNSRPLAAYGNQNIEKQLCKNRN